jgi:molybdate transport system regulatory protein
VSRKAKRYLDRAFVFARIREGDIMALSARNQFPGTVMSIKHGAVMSEVIVDIGGGNQIVSLISTSSVKRLKLKKGSRAIAVIKATEVIISTDLAGED